MIKEGELVYIPAGYYPNGDTRPYTPAIVLGFTRHLYSSKATGEFDSALVRDDKGTWLLPVDSIRTTLVEEKV